MNTARLPQRFLDKIKTLLGEAEYEAWLSSYEERRHYGLRVNRLKLSPEQYVRLSPFASYLLPIPWTVDGFYYEESERPGIHPHYHAGLYYIQEPSAMAPAAILAPRPGDKVLDLCAAPGGKSTQLASALQGTGLLVANDNARERTKVLAKNIELAGVRNAVVLNEEPSALARVFEGFFNTILVDAPCSGEGMFRKDDSMIAEWEKHSVERCALMQRDILAHACKMLAPGGRLLYSTCTFSPEENEAQVASVLAEHSDMRIVAIPHAHGFAPGQPDWADVTTGLDAKTLQTLHGTARLWPHLVKGEGHYAALLERDTKDETVSIAQNNESEAAFLPLLKRARMKDKSQSRSRRGAEIPQVDGAALWRAFAESLLPGALQWPGSIVLFGGRVYLQPDGVPSLDGLQVVRAGLYLGEAKPGRFEPSQALAMASRKADAARALELDYDRAASGGEAAKYLRGETLHISEERIERSNGEASPNGYVLVCIDGYPIGWGKWNGGNLKNELAPGWRRM